MNGADQHSDHAGHDPAATTARSAGHAPVRAGTGGPGVTR